MLDWLAKFGKKALEAGAGYIEFRKFLIELSQMPDEAAVAALRERVWGMSDAAYLGFRVVVASMIQQEQQAMQQLQQSGRYSFGQSFEDQMAAFQAGAWGRVSPEQQQQLQLAQGRVNWLGGVLRYADHFRNERAAHGRGALAQPGTPAHEQSSASPEAQRLIDAIRAPGAVESMLERARAREEAPVRGRSPGQEERMQRLVRAFQEGKGMPEMLEIIREEFEDQVASGKIAPERRAHYESVLDRLRSMVTRDDEDLATKMAVLAECQQMMREWSAMTVAPSEARGAGHPRGSRAERVGELIRLLGTHVMHACAGAQHMSGQEGERAMDLYSRWIKARNAAAEPAEDEQVRRNEREGFRRLAWEFQAFALRAHLMMARPIWKWEALAVDPNRVFYSGAERVGEFVEAACGRIGMDVARAPVTQDPGQSRWDMLRSSSVAVFDFTRYDAELWRRDLVGAGRMAQVAYELGIAFVLGRPVVIVGAEGQAVPFDVDIEATLVDLMDEGESARRVAEAIDAAVYSPQRGESDSSVARSVAFVRGRAVVAGNDLLRVIVEQVEERKLEDPIFAANFLSACLATDTGGPMAALYPAWPGDYPESPRCFHVTAFREWTAGPSAAIARACEGCGVEYVRGDESLDSDIIRAIWDEICRATHVVADLTEANPNAALELGMAHALGKPVLIMTQHEQAKLFPSIAKQRMYRYDVEKGMDALRQKVAGFLRQA